MPKMTIGRAYILPSTDVAILTEYTVGGVAHFTYRDRPEQVSMTDGNLRYVVPAVATD